MYDVQILRDSVSRYYPISEISYYWSEDDSFGFIFLVSSALDSMRRHVITLSRGGVSIVLSLRFFDVRKSRISRLRMGLPVNRIYFNASDLSSYDEDGLVLFLFSLIDGVL